MAIATVTTRRFSFRAVHSLNSGLHREKTHGHHYLLEVGFHRVTHVEVAGVVERHVIQVIDGHDLTELIQPATGEVLVEWIHGRLAAALPGKIVGVALQETLKNRFVSAESAARWI